MPRVLRIALPLLLAAAVLAMQVLRGRAPSRQAINVGASVLLLVYVATTAGLGIFWVASQQLPVFDWHCLFGCGTVLLVSLHLVFDFPLVWRFIARRGRAATEAAPAGGAPRRARRGVLGGPGVIAAAGAAFTLGLRHGRSELKIEAPSGPGAPAGPTASDPAAQALAFVERFHAFASHSRSGVLTAQPGGGGVTPAAAAGPGASTTHRAAAPSDEAPRWRAPSPAVPGATLGVTAAVHAASSLRLALASSPASVASAATPLHRPLAQALTALPPAAPVAPVAPDWLGVIAQRRAVCRYTTRR